MSDEADDDDAAWQLLAVACPDLTEGELEDAIPHIAKALAAVRAEEREACAKVADKRTGLARARINEDAVYIGADIAAGIRARKP
jgi:hypothetical protein